MGSRCWGVGIGRVGVGVGRGCVLCLGLGALEFVIWRGVFFAGGGEWVTGLTDLLCL